MIKGFRGSILHFLSEPTQENLAVSYQCIDDGLLLISDEKIISIGEYSKLIKNLDKHIEITDYSGKILMPGFIDTHIHFPQLEIIAAYGRQLLEWLSLYVFPTEGKYSDKAYSSSKASFFLEELLRNGTTTAMIYPTVHINSVETLFEEAEKLGMCIISGKVLMDRNAPLYLTDTPKTSYEESKYLINKWHSKCRLKYAITPRFAITSTEEQLEIASTLKKEFPDVYIQTHLSENKEEVKLIKQLYPWSIDYINVYEKFNLLTPKTILGHCIYLSARGYGVVKETKSVISWCPSSNFFLGSGVFNLQKAIRSEVNVAIGSDVGGGNRIFMLQVLNEAYKAAALKNIKLSPFSSLYTLTLGNAKLLGLQDEIGNFETGKYADFVVLDPCNTPLMNERMKNTRHLEDTLFTLQMLADNRCVKATYIKGELKYENKSIYY